MDKREREAAVREYELLHHTGHEHFGFYLKGLGLYAGVVGVTLKFFFDAHPGSREQWAFFLFGAGANVAAIVLTLVGRKSYLQLHRRSRRLGEKLGFEDVHFPGRVAMADAFLTLIVMEAAGWMSLLLVVA